MSVDVKNNRWTVSDHDFATRIIVPDLKGFFDNLPLIGNAPKGRELVIEPGTRALLIDEGHMIGEVGPGSYTIESFVERLQFWRNRQTTIFLVRQEDVALTTELTSVPSLEHVCLHVSSRWTVQIKDILPFMENLMGAREALSIQALHELLNPMVEQAIYSTIGNLSIDDATGPRMAEYLADGLRSQVDMKFQRYGLQFVDLQAANASCDDDRWKQRQGELWIEGREIQLQQAASKVENDELNARLADIRTKIPIRQELRNTVSSDKLNAIHSKEEFQNALLELDKGRVLRQEERDALVAAYEERKEDRGQLRDHLLTTMELHREQELDELRVDMDYAIREKTLQKELELSQLSHSEAAQQWRHELQQEQEQAAHRREQKHANVKARWERAREVHQQKRDDSWQAILHEQKMEEVRVDVEVTKAERQRKVALIQSDLESRLAAEKLEVEKRQKEWELEHKEKRSENQLDRMQKLQEMNAQFQERQQRLQIEMENLKGDSASQRELERIRAMSSLSTEALVATAGAENAALLADLKKHEATQDAVKVQATANPSAELNEERLKMYEKMNETERAKADAIAEAYKAAMQSQQGNVEQMIGGIAQVATPAPQQPVGFPPPMPVAEVWHVSLNGQQSPALQLAQVLQHIQSGQVTRDSMVWKTGMPSWTAAGQVPELAHLFPPAGPSSMPQ